MVLQNGIVSNFKFNQVSDGVIYDAFFERKNKIFYNNTQEICMDLYGSKKTYGNYLILASTRKLPYKLIREYGLIRKPHEVNVIQQEEGTGIYLYDLSVNASIPDRNEEALIRYDFGYLPWKKAAKHAFYGLKNGLKQKFHVL